MDNQNSIIKALLQACIPILFALALFYFMYLSFFYAMAGNSNGEKVFFALLGVFGGAFSGFTISKLTS